MTTRTDCDHWSLALCHDCGTDTPPFDGPGRAESYMVHDHVWAAAGLQSGLLCIGCLEQRLGRQLTAADSTYCPMNDLDLTDIHYAWSWRTPRLA